jgi:hypothetical protein
MNKIPLVFVILLSITACTNKQEAPAAAEADATATNASTDLGPPPPADTSPTEMPAPEVASADATTQQSSAERAGLGKFDASGELPCAQNVGQPMGQCPFQVARGPNGSATVVVTHTDGRKRAIFFENGKAVSADLSQADGNMDFSSSKDSDLFMIKAGNERFEIPEAVIFGG